MTAQNKHVPELDEQVYHLQQHVSKLQQANSRLRDDVIELKTNYTKLVDGLNDQFKTLVESYDARFETIRTRLQK